METYRSACNSTYLVKLTLEVGLVANWWRMTCSEGHFSSRLKTSLAACNAKNSGVQNTQHVRIHHLFYTNIAPENWWLEYDFPIGEAYFQGRLLLVSGRVQPPINSFRFKPCAKLEDLSCRSREFPWESQQFIWPWREPQVAKLWGKWWIYGTSSLSLWFFFLGGGTLVPVFLFWTWFSKQYC